MQGNKEKKKVIHIAVKYIGAVLVLGGLLLGASACEDARITDVYQELPYNYRYEGLGR